MNSIHDMGGMHGFGPIPVEENEPVFHEDWEGRVYAISTQTRVKFPHGSRAAIESMDPAHYLSSTYYEKWLHVRIEALIAAGTITRDEWDEQIQHILENPDFVPQHTEDPKRLQKVLSNIHAPRTHRKKVDRQPAFQIGDSVRTKNIHPSGHTRLPRYARGKKGVVVKYYGIQQCDDVLPDDTIAEPQPLYAVRFVGEELWGESAEPNSATYLDMWELYLEEIKEI